MKETDVARPVVQYLEDRGLNVYQEVLLKGTSSVADIVAVENDSAWIVEVKVTLSWDLLSQAAHRKRWAQCVSIAVPYRKWNYKTKTYLKGMLHREGFGLLFVKDNGTVVEVVPPPLLNDVWHSKKLIASLNDAQKSFSEAGTAGGGHWSPFKQTCIHIAEQVRSNPGITLKDLVPSIDHHYKTEASAKGSIMKWAKKGVIDGITIRKSNGEWCLYPKRG